MRDRNYRTNQIAGMEASARAYAERFGWCVGALFRISEGVADPAGAAREALERIGIDFGPMVKLPSTPATPERHEP